MFYFIEAILGNSTYEKHSFNISKNLKTQLNSKLTVCVHNLFREEVVSVLQNARYTGMWSFYAAASILGITVSSVYPQFGAGTVREHLHRTLMPQDNSSATQDKGE